MAVQRLVSRIHFSDLGSTEFERLCFAYTSRLRDWSKIEWIGQTGSDGGRDIWGEHASKSYCYQCANYSGYLVLKKVTDDIDKLQKGKTVPDNFIVISGGNVGAETRENIVKYAKTVGIKNAGVWSGVEFEEMLRREAPELIERFVNGEVFPETPKDLVEFSKNALSQRDGDIISAILQNIDRPAFTTRFRGESSLPNFDKAIGDTIILLNTGVHKLTDGTIIGKLPSRHQIKQKDLKDLVSSLTNKVVELRDTFLRFKNSGDIKECGCDQPDCPVFTVSDIAADKVDMLRQEVFDIVKKIDPKSTLSFSS